MKTTIGTMIMVAALLGAAQFASSAASGNEDGSQLAVWIFLGMCALIVVVQLLPVVFMAVGFIRGLIKGSKEPKEAPAEVIIDE